MSGVEDAGADTTTAPESGSSADGDTTPTGECSVNDDCVAKLPATTPAGCAVATCDTLQKKCHFKAKDADGDGHTAKNCSAATATIEAGDDCDDGDPSTYPGAWDGPATDFDSGAGVESDRCDQKDNDCNGSPDDGKLKVDGGDKTCKCDPNKPLPCYEYPNGTPIDAATLDANNAPKGTCKKGTRTCVAGIPSACSGAVGPAVAEVCDTLDHDCNGVSGNAGDPVATAPVWYKDSDNDNYGDVNAAPKQQCVSPAGLWKNLIPNTDCDDADVLRNPGLAEVCDGKDNNCNTTVDEGVKSTFCADVDADGYCTATCVQACNAPVGYRAQNTCSVGVDCNDTAGAGANIHPNATEYCGDGVDSNCTGGDSETFANLGLACTAGTFGVCKRKGTYVCTAAKTGTECSVTAGTATGAADHTSADPLIDVSQARGGYDPKWDWNCDNNQTVADTVWEGGFRVSACGGSYEAACNTLSQSQCETGFLGVKNYTCDYNPPPWWVTGTGACGHPYNYIACLWGWNTPGVCGWTGALKVNNGNISCQ